MDMRDKATNNSKQVLEYTKVLDLVRLHCRTERGYDSFLDEDILPSELDRHASYIQDLMFHEVVLPSTPRRLGGITESITAAKKGRRLRPAALYDIKTWMQFYQRVQGLLEHTAECHALAQSRLSSEINKALVPFTEEGVDASKDAQLQSYRQRMQGLKKQRYAYTKREIGKQTALFRSQEPALRNNRLTFALASGARLEQQTILTDSSDSQATHYVEDERLIGFNNAVQGELKHIEERIDELCSIASQTIAEHADAFFLAEDSCTYIDRLCAKASYGVEIGGSVLVPDGDNFLLHGARHPLLLMDFCPIHIALDKGRRMLFLSGMNGGGKSITMKTLAVLVLMAHQGIPLPVEADSQMPLCTGIHCVIGDEQSIQDAHSSFTGRIERIVDICHSQKKNELIILDEFGSETDPAEGAAIITALLERLIDTEQWVAFSSHIHQCKLFADTHPQIRCASLQCTQIHNKNYYSIAYDAIGLSNALEIAERFGMDADIIHRAKSILEADEGYRSYTSYIREKAALAEQRAFFEAETQRIQKEEKKLQDQTLSLEISLQNELTTVRTELKKIKQKTESSISTIKKDIEDADHASEVDKKQAEKEIKQMRSDLAQLERDLSEKKNASVAEQKTIIPLDQLKEGDFISTSLITTPVCVEKIVENRNYVEVTASGKRMRIPFAQIREIRRAQVSNRSGKAPVPRFQKRDQKSTEDNARVNDSSDRNMGRNTIDLRGERVVEALLGLERFVLESLEQGYAEICIIHGMGTGSLRQAVQEFLRENRRVTHFRFGELHEGSHGATIAQLIN